MGSFLSGFSTSGMQAGPSYAGNAVSSGSFGSGGQQGVDVTQLQAGDTFQGEIVSVNGEEVQIQLTTGEYMVARLERDVQIAIGQLLNLQVQSNKDNKIVLKPVYDGRMQMLRVGEAALRAAHMSLNDKNMTLVSTLLENGMSINKNSLMAFNRLMLQNPGVSMADLIKLNKLQLPINDTTVTQLHNYQGMEYRLLDGIREASEEILKLYDTLTGKAGVQGSGNQNTAATQTPTANTQSGAGANTVNGAVANILPNGMTSGVQGQAVLENGGKFMEQVLVLLAGDEGQDGGAWQVMDGNTGTVNTQEGQGVQNGQNTQNTENTENTQNTQNNQSVQDGQGAQNNQDIQSNQDAQNNQNVQNAVGNGEENVSRDSARAPLDKSALEIILSQLKGEKPQALPNKIISAIREGIKDGRLDIKDVKQLLLDSDIGKQLTTEQKSVIFHSEPFKSMLKNGLQKQWTLRPQDLAQEGRVEEFYQKLANESRQLARMMNEAMQGGGHGGAASQARAMNNINENVEFMNQMNQVFNYVQLPLKFGNSQAHGDLYVYTNKKNLARKDGTLTAFLHLDMDNLGSLDVSISLQTEKNQVTTKFYLDEDSIALVEGHIDELAQRLAKKGYKCKNMILEKEESKTVLEHMEEQVAGGNAVLGYRTFDTRA